VKTENLIVVSFQHTGVDNLYHLPPYLEVDERPVMIHHNPAVRMMGNKFQANAHIFADFLNPNGDTDALAKIGFGRNYHPIRRYAKSHQVALLEAYKLRNPKSLLHDIRIPTTMGNFNTAHSGQYLMSPLDHLGTTLGPDEFSITDRVVVKPEHGARGRGHALTNVANLRRLLVDIDLPLSELKTLYPDVIFTDPDPNSQDQKEKEEMVLFQPGDFVVSEYIDNVVAEYRVLFGGDTVYMAEREREGDGYLQANLNNKQRGSRTFDKLEKDHYVYRLTKEIASAQKLPLGSIDFFKTDDGEYGFFECCPQFGTWATPQEVAWEVHVGFLRYIIDKYEESKGNVHYD